MFLPNSNHNLTRTGGFSDTTHRGKTCSQHSINKRLGRHAAYGASAFQAYLLPPYSGSSMCPQAAGAAELCIPQMISSISAADKPGWALIELKLKFDHLTIPIPFTVP